MRPHLDWHLDDTALRLLALDPDGLSAADAAHLAGCARCRTRAAAAARGLDAVRTEAHAAADTAFTPADLERQRRSIMARIARGARPARVLPFPRHDGGMPAPRADRRWLSVAAAAGLVLGALIGQLPHLGGAGSTSPDSSTSEPAVVAARADARPLEDTLLSEVEAALDADVRPELRALDQLTPVHYEIR